MPQESPAWSQFGRISFRIALVYFLLYFNPLAFLFSSLLDPLTYFLNDHLFHINSQLNQARDGAGDTSFAWAQVFTYILLAFTGGLVWAKS